MRTIISIMFLGWCINVTAVSLHEYNVKFQSKQTYKEASDFIENFAMNTLVNFHTIEMRQAAAHCVDHWVEEAYYLLLEERNNHEAEPADWEIAREIGSLVNLMEIRAWAFRDAKLWELAIKSGERLVSGARGTVRESRELRLLAVIYLKMHNDQMAISLLEEAKTTPLFLKEKTSFYRKGSWGVLYLLAKGYLNSGQVDLAIENYGSYLKKGIENGYFTTKANAEAAVRGVVHDLERNGTTRSNTHLDVLINEVGILLSSRDLWSRFDETNPVSTEERREISQNVFLQMQENWNQD